jgi:hypothetical protein
MEDMLVNEGFQKIVDGRHIVLDHAYMIYPEHTCICHIFGDRVVILVDGERRLGHVTMKNLFETVQAENG